MLIAAAVEVRRLAGRLEDFVRAVELELKPTMQEARAATRRLQQAARGATDTTERVRGALTKLQRAGESVRATTGKVRTMLSLRFIPALSLAAGVRTGTKVLWNLYTHRRATP